MSELFEALNNKLDAVSPMREILLGVMFKIELLVTIENCVAFDAIIPTLLGVKMMELLHPAMMILDAFEFDNIKEFEAIVNMLFDVIKLMLAALGADNITLL